MAIGIDIYEIIQEHLKLLEARIAQLEATRSTMTINIDARGATDPVVLRRHVANGIAAAAIPVKKRDDAK